MNLRDEILKKYKSEYEFAVNKKISPQLVNYWCKKGFKNLRLDIQYKVVKLLEFNKKGFNCHDDLINGQIKCAKQCAVCQGITPLKPIQ